MEIGEITLEVLKDLRDEVREVRGESRQFRDEFRGELRQVRGELRQVRDELGQVRDELRDAREDHGALARRQVESEVRLSTEIVALAGVVREVRDAIRDDRVSRARVDDHENRITVLEGRQGSPRQ